MSAPETRRVVLVCVAGISSTFLARRMRSAAPGLRITVADLRSLADVVAEADAVLVAPQLAGSIDEVRRIASGVPVALMPDAPSAERHLAAVASLEALLASGAAAEPSAAAAPLLTASASAPAPAPAPVLAPVKE